MTYQTEFPDFPAADMPDIPATWRDISWHNDACPCFEFMTGGEGDSNYQSAVVWIAERDPAAREFQNGKRFLISYREGFTESLDVLETDDWAAVLAYAAPRETIGQRYLETVGYNPFLDDPSSDPAAIAESLYVTRRFLKLETAY